MKNNDDDDDDKNMIGVIDHARISILTLHRLPDALLLQSFH